jgi:hypothetical protein
LIVRQAIALVGIKATINFALCRAIFRLLPS